MTDGDMPMPLDASPSASQQLADYDKVKAAIAYCSEHWRDQPSLETIAAEIGLSPTHFQK